MLVADAFIQTDFIWSNQRPSSQGRDIIQQLYAMFNEKSIQLATI